ncbi:uncharacterized protein LOC113305944 [Papaver somniferum]|uniref:uncharacterized protein LOC113305944 n=1 Tax=Papaver somniferum TaxID=3469 RepID=UPI000E70529E|nr:uncharacterized protein LOC113305944 [Papaver somniferum]
MNPEDPPSLFILDEVIEKSLNEWKFSLIGRLDLVKLNINVAATSLKQQWDIKGSLQFIPLGKGFFIIKLDNEADRSLIWKGLWMVESQILKLRAWEPNFNPETQKTSSAFVWISFPGLSIEYWKERILLQMGSKLGRAIKVDEVTLRIENGYYASVLVEVDFAKLIPRKVVVEYKAKRTEYQRLLHKSLSSNGGKNNFSQPEPSTCSQMPHPTSTTQIPSDANSKVGDDFTQVKHSISVSLLPGDSSTTSKNCEDFIQEKHTDSSSTASSSKNTEDFSQVKPKASKKPNVTTRNKDAN